MTLFERFVRSTSWIMWLARGVFVSVVLALLIMRSVITVIRVDGHSMDPTLRNGQWVAVNLAVRHFRSWQLGDMVILRFPGDPLKSLYVKRIIGLPGDTVKIEDGNVMRNGTHLTETYLSSIQRTEAGAQTLPDIVPEHSYIVLGDNRLISNDSRFFGVVPETDMVGLVMGN